MSKRSRPSRRRSIVKRAKLKVRLTLRDKIARWRSGEIEFGPEITFNSAGLATDITDYDYPPIRFS